MVFHCVEYCRVFIPWLLHIWVIFGLAIMAKTAMRVKRLPAMQETWVRFLGWEDPPGEGNGNPLQHSCLENPMDGRA